MDKLQQARKQINEIDKELAKLFEKRMDAVKLVAEHKREHSLPVLNATREQEVIKRGLEYIESPDIKDYYVNFAKHTMELSKQYQRRILSGNKVAYCGVEGAFAHIAATRIFKQAEYFKYDSFSSAYKAVETGECDCAVLPIENSYSGDVDHVMDLGFFVSLYISGIYDLEITQNLIGLKGTHASDVKKVISHPQALSQCAEYIKEHNLEKIESSNTAVSAKHVLELGDKTVAAIASEETAKLYGLEVLDRAINQSRTNSTRFAVFTRTLQQSENCNRFIMYFTVRHEAGSLSKAIAVFAENNLNLQALKSRPTKGENFVYYFYVEGEGNLAGDSGKVIIDKLKKQCDNLKVIGIYDKELKI